MIIRARTVVTMSGRPIENGAVVVVGPEIRDVGPCSLMRAEHSGHETVDLGEQVLMPGLINAHCHLDYTAFKGLIRSGQSFTKWVGQINALKRCLGDEEFLRSIAAGFEELIRWGTTTVLNIESFPELIWQMPEPPIRTWWFMEMIDLRHREATEEFTTGSLRFIEGPPLWNGGFGLSPHAPYTASKELYRMANACAEKLGLLLTTHVAESLDEDAMFRGNDGPMADFMRSIGRNMTDCDGHSSFAHLIRHGLLKRDWILVHLNELGLDDFALIESTKALRGMHVVHCPQSHRYFLHRPFQLDRLRRLGANISLGTDSLASGETLSLFTEMRLLRETNPSMQAYEILEMVTKNPACALRQRGRLGEITPGAYADLIALPFSAKLDSVYDEILEQVHPVRWMMSHGRIIV